MVPAFEKITIWREEIDISSNKYTNQSRRNPEGEKITLGGLGKALQGKSYLIQDSVGKSEFARMGAAGEGHSKCSEQHMHTLGVMKDHGMFWKLLRLIMAGAQ